MSVHTVNILDKEIELEVIYFFGGRPAKIHALPEDCYPEEGPEVDWNYTDNVLEFDQEAIENSDKWQELITDQLLEQLMREPEDNY